ncbi:response regulator [Bacillus cihuensis]|uniref:response regulator n=1 Tax=Bacillus cihuensis TaxID=1208599 RepID=UPI000685AEBD|nr:response regulator [Bacillus cihuensis]
MIRLRKHSILITVIYVFIYYIWMLLWPEMKLIGGIIAITGPLLAILFIGSSLRRIQEKEEKNFWVIICIGCINYFIAELIWRYRVSYLEMADPFPGWANLFYNLFVFIYSIAVFYKVFAKRKKYRTIQVFFDSFIIMTVLTTISWVYFLSPLLPDTTTSTFELVIALSYPVAVLGVLFGIVLLFLTSMPLFPPVFLTLNTIGITVYTIVESYYVYQAIYHTYNGYFTFLTPIWNICILLIGLSSFFSKEVNDVPRKETNLSKLFYISRTILPFLSLIVLLFLTIIKKEAILSYFIGGAVLLLLIVIRQIITIFENETLVRKLKERTAELEITQHELLELKEVAEEQSWLKTKIADIATMYPGIGDLETLAHLFITKVTPMVGANYGVFYIKQGNGDEERFQKLASYAYNQAGIGAESFRLGEGLVGQCAVENRMISLNQVPENYIKITSGLGSTPPSNVLIIPAEFQGEVLAVIELASFELFTDPERMLLKEVMSNLGINIESIIRNMEVEKLLQESQALTEELQTQSEELQSQQEELRTVNEQLQVQNENSEQKTRELEKVKGILEEKAQQLIISSQYKSEFLANMSHELRTPLNSLLILAQLLADNDDGNFTSKQVEYARTIFSSGNDLLYLINDILDIAKVEAGKTEVIFKDVKLSDVKEFVNAQFIPVARKKKIKFNVQVDADVPEMIKTDSKRLQQILKNLLSNAFKFTEYGAISLAIQKVEKGSIYTNANIEFAFSVKDTGIGIAAENQNIIFDAFKQADGIISRKYGGTGLGLSISRELAQLLGGFIEIDSVEGKGSTFTLYLPNYKNLESAELSISEAEVASGIFEESVLESAATVEFPLQTDDPKQMLGKKELLEGKKLLVVDDDMRNIFVLTTALESFQVEVLFAENGNEGIAVLQENADIDLVLMDIMMPEMDGFEAIQYIRQIPKFQNIPIIALTAKAMKYDRQQCIEAGASDYISKPVNLEQLFSIMRVWLYR